MNVSLGLQRAPLGSGVGFHLALKLGASDAFEAMMAKMEKALEKEVRKQPSRSVLGNMPSDIWAANGQHNKGNTPC